MKAAKEELKNTLLIALGILSAGMGLKGFLLSSRFIDGGVTGISMLLADVVGMPLALWLIIVNLPFIVLGYRQLGMRFAIKSTLALGGLSACVALVPYPDVTPDKLLTAVFGGFFIGAGIGLAVRGGAVLDGTEIAALLVSRRSAILRVGDVILILNVFIFGTATFFLGIESALYSMLTYFSASKTVDFLIYGIEEHTAVIIIAEKNDSIREAILRRMNRGVTVLRGRGGKSGTEKDVLYCVVTRLEVGRVKKLAKDLDASAFIAIHSLADAEGGVMKRSLLH